MLNSAEQENFPAHKCSNANNFLRFNIHEQENSIIGLFEPEKAEFLDILVFASI